MHTQGVGCSRVDVEAGGLAASLLHMRCEGAEEIVMSPSERDARTRASKQASRPSVPNGRPWLVLSRSRAGSARDEDLALSKR